MFSLILVWSSIHNLRNLAMIKREEVLIMSSSRKKYSKDFKDMLVELYKNGKTSTEICQEYGIGI